MNTIPLTNEVIEEKNHEAALKALAPFDYDKLTNFGKKEAGIYLQALSPMDVSMVECQGYLSDCKDFNDKLDEIICNNPGAKLLVQAPCGIGKTYAMLTRLQEAYFGEAQVVLCVPTNNQAFQNRQYGFTKDGHSYITTCIAGKSGETFDGWDCKHPISCVYDTTPFLLDRTEEELSQCILVIDETHLMYTQKNFRSKALNGVLNVANQVAKAGGTVITMTATPEKIYYQGFDYFIYVKQVDKEGHELPAIKADHIRVIRKPYDVHEKPAQTLLTSLIEDHKDGKRALVMLNDKDTCYALLSRLEGLGISAGIITADQKEKSFDPSEGYGHGRKSKNITMSYTSKDYETLVNDSALLDKDVILCTSLLEVGTSIEGIMKNGEKVVPGKDEVVPYYVCLGRNKFDLDSIQQFGARFRFPYDEYRIVLFMEQQKGIGKDTYCFYRTDLITKEAFLSAAFNETKRNSNAVTHGSSRDLTNAKGRKTGMFLDTTNRVERNGKVDTVTGIIFSDLAASALSRYYMQGYRSEEHMQTILEDRFHLPVTQELFVKDKGLWEQAKEAESISAVNKTPELVARLHSYVQSEEFDDALADREYKHPFVQGALNLINENSGSDAAGMAVLLEYQELKPQAPSKEDAIDLAIDMMSGAPAKSIKETKDSWAQNDYEIVGNIPVEHVVDAASYIYFMHGRYNYFTGHKEGHGKTKDSYSKQLLDNLRKGLSDKEYNALTRIAMSRKALCLARLYHECWYRGIGVTWKNIMSYNVCGEEKLDFMYDSLLYIVMNRDAARKKHLPTRRPSDAEVEYIILHELKEYEQIVFPGKKPYFAHFDENGRTPTMITSDVLTHIGNILSGAMSLCFGIYRKAGYYSNRNIRKKLYEIYDCKFVTAKKKGHAFMLDGYAMDYSLVFDKQQVTTSKAMQVVADHAGNLIKANAEDSVLADTYTQIADNDTTTFCDPFSTNYNTVYHMGNVFNTLRGPLTAMAHAKVTALDIRRNCPHVTAEQADALITMVDLFKQFNNWNYVYRKQVSAHPYAEKPMVGSDEDKLDLAVQFSGLTEDKVVKYDITYLTDQTDGRGEYNRNTVGGKFINNFTYKPKVHDGYGDLLQMLNVLAGTEYPVVDRSEESYYLEDSPFAA